MRLGPQYGTASDPMAAYHTRMGGANRRMRRRIGVFLVATLVLAALAVSLMAGCKPKDGGAGSQDLPNTPEEVMKKGGGGCQVPK